MIWQLLAVVRNFYFSVDKNSLPTMAAVDLTHVEAGEEDNEKNDNDVK